MNIIKKKIMSKNIYRVNFIGSDGKEHAETNWHSDKKYCDDYITQSENPELKTIEIGVLMD